MPTSGKLCQSGDFDEDIKIGGALPVVDALQRGHVEVVPADTDADVLLVDLAVVCGVEIPPTSGPGLNPGMALPVDGLTDHCVVAGMVVSGHITRRNSHAAQHHQ